MTLKGYIKHGNIVLDEPVRLPEGTHVIIKIDKSKGIDAGKVAGIWKDDRSSKEIVKDIYSARKSKK